MAVESFWDGNGQDVGNQWFANKDMKDIVGAIGQDFAPTLLDSLRRYARSMTPEGRRRLGAAFRQRALSGAGDVADAQAVFARSQGLSPSYRTGLGINAFNDAQRRSTAYDAQLNDPSRDAQTSLGIFGGLHGMRGDETVKSSSFLGDLFNIAGNVAPMFLGGAGAAGKIAGGTQLLNSPGGFGNFG